MDELKFINECINGCRMSSDNDIKLFFPLLKLIELGDFN